MGQEKVVLYALILKNIKIPVVDASNSYARMREFLETSGDYERLNDRLLRGLCLYLDDLRTIKNIVNEFQIYRC